MRLMLSGFHHWSPVSCMQVACNAMQFSRVSLFYTFSELGIISNNISRNHLNLKVETTAWPPMSSSNNQYLLLDNVPVLDRSEDYENNMNFWRQLFPC